MHYIYIYTTYIYIYIYIYVVLAVFITQIRRKTELRAIADEACPVDETKALADCVNVNLRKNETIVSELKAGAILFVLYQQS